MRRKVSSTNAGGQSMMEKVLNSRSFVAAIFAMATGVYLFYAYPFPEHQVFLQVISIRAPHAYLSFKGLYIVFLFTTPYMGYLGLLSGIYIFTLKTGRCITAGRLPHYPDPRKRNELFLVVGEVHNPRKAVPSENPYWLVDSRAGTVHGHCHIRCHGERAKQAAAYTRLRNRFLPTEPIRKKRIGGLILEVKGDFCRKARGILERHGQARRLHRNQS